MSIYGRSSPVRKYRGLILTLIILALMVITDQLFSDILPWNLFYVFSWLAIIVAIIALVVHFRTKSKVSKLTEEGVARRDAFERILERDRGKSTSAERKS